MDIKMDEAALEPEEGMDIMHTTESNAESINPVQSPQSSDHTENKDDFEDGQENESCNIDEDLNDGNKRSLNDDDDANQDSKRFKISLDEEICSPSLEGASDSTNLVVIPNDKDESHSQFAQTSLVNEENVSNEIELAENSFLHQQISESSKSQVIDEDKSEAVIQDTLPEEIDDSEENSKAQMPTFSSEDQNENTLQENNLIKNIEQSKDVQDDAPSQNVLQENVLVQNFDESNDLQDDSSSQSKNENVLQEDITAQNVNTSNDLEDDISQPQKENLLQEIIPIQNTDSSNNSSCQNENSLLPNSLTKTINELTKDTKIDTLQSQNDNILQENTLAKTANDSTEPVKSLSANETQQVECQDEKRITESTSENVPQPQKVVANVKNVQDSSENSSSKMGDKFIIGKSFLVYVQNPEMAIFKSPNKGLYKWFDCLLCGTSEMTSNETLVHIRTKEHALSLMQIESPSLYMKYKDYKNLNKNILLELLEVEKALPDNKIMTCNYSTYDFYKYRLQNRVLHERLRLFDENLNFPCTIKSTKVKKMGTKEFGNLKIFIIGDSRVLHFKWKSKYLVAKYLQDASLESINSYIEKEKILSKFDVIILLPFFQELVEMSPPRTLKLNTGVNICEQIDLLVSIDKKWKVINEEVSILWLLPQAPDFERLRTDVKEPKSNLKNSYEVSWFTNKIEVASEILKYFTDVCFLNLLDFNYQPGSEKLFRIKGVTEGDSTINGVHPSKKILARFLQEFKAHLISEDIIPPPLNSKISPSNSRKPLFPLAHVPPQCYEKTDEEVTNFIEEKLMISCEYFKVESSKLLQYDTFHPFYLARKNFQAKNISTEEVFCLSKDEIELLLKDLSAFKVENQVLTYNSKIVIPSLRAEALCMLFVKCFGNIHSKAFVQILNSRHFFFENDLKESYIKLLKSNVEKVYAQTSFMEHTKKVQEIFEKWNKLNYPKEAMEKPPKVAPPPTPSNIVPSDSISTNKRTDDRGVSAAEPSPKKKKISSPAKVKVAVPEIITLDEGEEATVPREKLPSQIVMVIHQTNTLLEKLFSGVPGIAIKKYSSKPSEWASKSIIVPAEGERNLYIFVLDINLFCEDETQNISICTKNGCSKPLKLQSIQKYSILSLKELISSAASFVKGLSAKYEGSSGILAPFQIGNCIFENDAQVFHDAAHKQPLVPNVIAKTSLLANITFGLSYLQNFTSGTSDSPFRLIVKEANNLKLKQMKEFDESYDDELHYFNQLVSLINSHSTITIDKFDRNSFIGFHSDEKITSPPPKKSDVTPTRQKPPQVKLKIQAPEDTTGADINKEPPKQNVLIIGKKYLHVDFPDGNKEYINFNLSHSCSADAFCIHNRRLITSEKEIWVLLFDFTLVGKIQQIDKGCADFSCKKAVSTVGLKNADQHSRKYSKMTVMELIKERIEGTFQCAKELHKFAGSSSLVLICPIFPSLLFSLDPAIDTQTQEAHNILHEAYDKDQEINLLKGENYAWVKCVSSLEKTFNERAKAFLLAQGLDKTIIDFVYSKNSLRIVSNVDEVVDQSAAKIKWEKNILLLISHASKVQVEGKKTNSESSLPIGIDRQKILTEEEEQDLKEELDSEYEMYAEFPQLHTIYQQTYNAFLKSIESKKYELSEAEIELRWLSYWDKSLGPLKEKEWERIKENPFPRLKEREELDLRLTPEDYISRNLAPYRKTRTSGQLEDVDKLMTSLEKNVAAFNSEDVKTIVEKYRQFGGLTLGSIETLCQTKYLAIIEKFNKVMDFNDKRKNYNREVSRELHSVLSFLKSLVKKSRVNAEAIAHASVGKDGAFIKSLIEAACACEGVSPKSKELELIENKVDFFHYFLK